jgi:hypothetical protein
MRIELFLGRKGLGAVCTACCAVENNICAHYRRQEHEQKCFVSILIPTRDWMTLKSPEADTSIIAMVSLS